MSEAAGTILLWGDTQTGKSSLVAAALFDDPERLPGIDMSRTGEEANAVGLNEQWRALREGRTVQSTPAPVDVRIHRKTGAPIRLRDVPGGLIDHPADPVVMHETLQPATVILFVMNFHAPDPIRELRAIDQVWAICNNAMKGLVFTKCELRLDSDHRAWQGRRKWWQEFSDLGMLSRFLERFDEAVFPTSVYGYHPGSRAPALTLGEFGEVRPFGISPQGIIP